MSSAGVSASKLTWRAPGIFGACVPEMIWGRPLRWLHVAYAGHLVTAHSCDRTGDNGTLFLPSGQGRLAESKLRSGALDRGQRSRLCANPKCTHTHLK
jgi:hypothetical protein